MIASSTLTLSNIPHAPSPTTSPPLSEHKSSSSSPNSDRSSSPGPRDRRIKTSPQLNRWSRARAIRSGRKLGRQVQLPTGEMNYSDSPSGVIVDNSNSNGSDLQTLSPRSDGASDGECLADWATGEHDPRDAVMCIAFYSYDSMILIFKQIDDVDRLMEVIAQAAKEGAMLVYTLADPSIAESARQAKTSLGEDYFRRIEAIEFTIKQDDGALPENLHKADIVLTGVSRTGKTPLSIYLSQKGYKVANVPIVMNVDLPRGLFEVDPEKVFALTINPVVLQTIRRARAKSLGFDDEIRSNYSEMDHVREELEFASKIFQQNPIWPVIEVSGKAIEETAAIVLRLYHDRKNRCSMPRISKRY
ncbi:hypothetical protein DH2020_032970 [Rehmannia glutinosa]|uniref:Pyruvate, phosphate dikinase regulatory protein n=1 Tax=Rehmannia glutinosa TaxID=99300 RepID=A0ABR0VDP1_REHGL